MGRIVFIIYLNEKPKKINIDFLLHSNSQCKCKFLINNSWYNPIIQLLQFCQLSEKHRLYWICKLDSQSILNCFILLTKIFRVEGGFLYKRRRRHVVSSNCITVSEQDNLINKTSPASFFTLSGWVPIHLALRWKQSRQTSSKWRPSRASEMTTADRKHSCLMGSISEISLMTERCSREQPARLGTEKVWCLLLCSLGSSERKNCSSADIMLMLS